MRNTSKVLQQNRPNLHLHEDFPRDTQWAKYVELGATALQRKILVVIPCLNEEDHLKGLMHKLMATNKMPGMVYIIVDGGSSDRTSEIGRNLAANYNNVHYLENRKRHQASAVNLAVATFGKDAEFLIRIDAHADYPERYCETLVEEADRTGADSVVVRMQTIGRKGFQRGVAAAQNSRLGNGGSAHRIPGKGGRWIDHGHHALMRISAFRTVGGYDETFKHNEDAELDVRLRRKGFNIWLTNHAQQIYYPREEPVDIFRQYIGYGFGRARTTFKHQAKLKVRQILPLVVAPAVLLACLSPMVPIFILPAICWALLCLGYGAWLTIQKGDPAVLSAGPAIMLMHLGWSIGFWKALLLKPIIKK